MPRVSNGVTAYNQNRAMVAGTSLLPLVPQNYAQADAALTNFWAPQAHTVQYDWDVGAWYGAHQRPGDASIRALLSKLFTVMQLAGVTYDNGALAGNYAWRDCSVQGIPLGAILAHGGRMLIQLPVRTAHDDQATAFFNWLTQDVALANRLITRSAATHALSHRKQSVLLNGERRFRVAEERGMTTGIRASIKSWGGETNHYGVNLPLFGDGNTNWFSGNTVNTNGGHGHFYMYFNPKDVGQCGGMMIGGENSGVSAISQTFVGHDFRARSEHFSPAGTYKWTAMDHGPNHMIEEFVVDLTDGWTWLQGMEATFDPTTLDATPGAVPSVTRRDDHKRVIIYALMDLLGNPPGNLTRAAKGRLEAHLTTLFNSVNLPQAVLRDIITECHQALGVAGVTIAGDGTITPSSPVTVTVAPNMNDAIQACSSKWGNSV